MIAFKPTMDPHSLDVERPGHNGSKDPLVLLQWHTLLGPRMVVTATPTGTTFTLDDLRAMVEELERRSGR